MAFEKKEGDVSLFPNTRRTSENNAPNFTGQALYNGELLDLSLWVKAPEGKPKFMSGYIKKHVPREQVPVDPEEFLEEAMVVPELQQQSQPESTSDESLNPTVEPQDDLPF